MMMSAPNTPLTNTSHKKEGIKAYFFKIYDSVIAKIKQAFSRFTAPTRQSTPSIYSSFPPKIGDIKNPSMSSNSNIKLAATPTETTAPSINNSMPIKTLNPSPTSILRETAGNSPTNNQTRKRVTIQEENAMTHNPPMHQLQIKEGIKAYLFRMISNIIFSIKQILFGLSKASYPTTQNKYKMQYDETGQLMRPGGKILSIPPTDPETLNFVLDKHNQQKILINDGADYKQINQHALSYPEQKHIFIHYCSLRSRSVAKSYENKSTVNNTLKTQ